VLEHEPVNVGASSHVLLAVLEVSLARDHVLKILRDEPHGRKCSVVFDRPRLPRLEAIQQAPFLDGGVLELELHCCEAAECARVLHEADDSARQRLSPEGCPQADFHFAADCVAQCVASRCPGAGLVRNAKTLAKVNPFE
jgi:hypothetical protein